MEGAEQEKRRLTLRTPKASRLGGFRKQEENGQPPLHFLTALNRACHPERAAVTEDLTTYQAIPLLDWRSSHSIRSGTIPAATGGP